MKNKEIRELSTKELTDKVKEERDRYSKMKFNNTVSPVENPSMLKATRRTIARLKTEARDRQLKGTK